MGQAEEQEPAESRGTPVGLRAKVTPSVTELEAMARRLRRRIVRMLGLAGSGHPGGSLSAVEILTTLYFAVMRHNPGCPTWPDRDRLVLSKGHAAPALYAALAEAGYFPLELLWTLRKLDSPLQGHPVRGTVPGVEISTGSLGQGLSVGVGMALAAKLDRRSYGVYVIIGDGESDEGQIWEAAMAAGHFAAQGRLGKLVAILDYNRMQIDGLNRDIMNLEPLADKWRSFGWQVLEVEDGHSFPQLLAALEQASRTDSQPTIIVAKTIKGKGVSFMEGVVDWHGKAPNMEQMEQALRELGEDDERGPTD